jgi:Family of unknown function (DUF6185)
MTTVGHVPQKRPLRIVVAVWLALAIPLVLAPSAGAAPPPADRVALTERLTVDARGDVPLVTSTGTVSANARSRLIPFRRLMVNDPDGDAYKGALYDATVSRWLAVFFTVNPASSSLELPRPSVRAGAAKVSTSTSDSLFGFEPKRGIGDWSVRASGSRMRFSLAPLDLSDLPRRDAPAHLTLRVLVDLRDAEFIGATAPPRTMVPGTPLEWTFEATREPKASSPLRWHAADGKRFGQLALTVEANGDAKGFMATNAGAWYTIVQPLLLVGSWLLPFGLLAFVRRRWKRAPAARLPRAARTLALLTALVVLGAAIGNRFWSRIFSETPIPEWLRWEAFAAFSATLGLLIAVVAVAARAHPLRRVVGIGVVGAALIGYLLQAPGPWPIVLPTEVLAVLGTLSALAMAAITGWLLTLLAQLAVPRDAFPPVSRVSTGILGAVLFTSWLWTSLHLWDATQALGDVSYAWAYQGAPATIADALVAGALNYPSWLTDASLGWLPFIVLVLALRYLAADAGRTRGGVPPAAQAAVVMTLFVSFIGGPWGGVYSFSVPICAMVALATLTPMVLVGMRRHERSEVVDRSWLLGRVDDAPRGNGGTWVRNGGTGDGPPGRAGVAAGAVAASSVARVGFLNQCGSALRHLRLGTLPPLDGDPAERTVIVDARREALSFGPTDDWWTNARLAVRIGSIVALPFALHYLIVLFVAQGSTLQPAWSPVACLWALRWVVSEYAFWIVGALALGALYSVLPGTTGLLKGAALAVVFALAQGAGELMPGQFDVLSWPAITAEVLIFFGVTGVLLDAETLRQHDVPREQLVGLYGLETWGAALRLVPFVGAVLLVLFQQLISGDASQALSDVLQAVPSVGGGSPSR